MLYAKINVKSNHFLFLTSLESPLHKGGSEGVWKYRWLLFTVQYDTLFANNDDLLSLKTVDLIKKYKCIYKDYRTANKTVTVQKAMYVLYLSEKLKSNKYKQISAKFESYLKSYKYDNNVDKAESRILLDQKFKNDVETYFGVNGKLNE